MADKYRNFQDLRKSEVEDKDFVIRVEAAEVPVAIIAPHGGKIEPGTSQVAAAISSKKYNLYCFEGSKRTNNRDLHVTSTNFDEPRCRQLVADCDVVVAVHGLAGKHERIDVGGLDESLRDKIAANLKLAGFDAKAVSAGAHAAISPNNICNLGRRGLGAQLEITYGLRVRLMQEEELMKTLADAVRQVIDANDGTP